MAAINDITDRYEQKKREVLEKLLGKEDKYPVKANVRKHLISPITTDGKTCYGKSMHKPSNPCAFDPWLHEFNERMHTCNGKIVTYVDEKLDKEIPPPVK